MATATFYANPGGIHALLSGSSSDLGRYMLKTGIKVQRLAKTRCPVDTGRLRASINVDLKPDNKVVVGTKVQYALFVHEGTRYVRARPFLRSAMTEVVKYRSGA